MPAETIGADHPGMPNATTMLEAYRALVDQARGAGLAGLDAQARVSSTVRALLEVVDRELDPRLDAA